MIPVDSQAMREVAPHFSGELAERQAAIVATVGEVLRAVLEEYDITNRSGSPISSARPAKSRRDFAPPRSLPRARTTRGGRISATSSRATADATRAAACSSSPAARTTGPWARCSASTWKARRSGPENRRSRCASPVSIGRPTTSTPRVTATTSLRVELVLTAHPTAITRRTLIQKHLRIAGWDVPWAAVWAASSD